MIENCQDKETFRRRLFEGECAIFTLSLFKIEDISLGDCPVVVERFIVKKNPSEHLSKAKVQFVMMFKIAYVDGCWLF